MHKKKAITMLILTVLLLTAVLSCMSGCTKKDKPFYYRFNRMFETDYFVCKYNEDETNVTILELTDKGQEQEILVIPEEINGLPVVQLGGETKGYPYVIPHYLKSPITRKMYVSASSLCANNSIKMDKLEDIVVYPFSQQQEIKVVYVDEKVRIYINKGIKGTSYFNDYGFHPSYENLYMEANVTFYSEPGIICFVDNYSISNLYIQPPIPQKEGYSFLGWYPDIELDSQWNESYPQYQSLDLYAKWKLN